MSLVGKLAFITGAGSGIGRATCQLFIKEGAIVVAADINLSSAKETVKETNEASRNNLAVQVDVANIKNVTSALEAVLKKYKKPPTIVVNCAGIGRDNYLLKMTQDDFQSVINTNLNGTFNIMHTFGNALASLKPPPGGSFINIASIAGKLNNIGQSNYSASKVGVEALTKTAAKEFGRFNIRCNALLPGLIDTPIISPVPEKILQNILRQIPLQRMGKPSEIAEVIAFLASERSSYVNGASIEITGGYF